MMRLRNVALVLAASVALSCSSDTAVGPGHQDPHASFTLELTSVSGTHIPAPYYSDAMQGYRLWADSATVTLQPDGVLAFRMYESGTAPLSAAHADQPSESFFASGRLSSDSTFEIWYSDSPTPDRGTINADGSVTVAFTGRGDDGASIPFGSWRFATAYHGPAVNPAPLITSITPPAVLVSSVDTTVTINGSSFMPASVVSWGAQTLQTLYVSATQLQVVLPAQYLRTPGTSYILVTNPAPGGGTYYYPISVHRAVPTITALSPNTVTAGGEIYDIMITGTGFETGTMVLLNGTMRPASGTVTSTSLTVGINPVDIAGAGVIQIAVMNPPPGGGTSASLPFTVTAAARHLTAEIIAPTSATIVAGDPVRPVVYAGEDHFDPVHPNSIIALDGATGRVLWSIPAGGAPTMLAVSDDGQFLYFGSNADSAIHRIALATATIDLNIPLPHGPLCSPQPHNAVVAPGNAHTLAVEEQCLPGLRSGWDAVTIYDDSVARPHVAFDDNSTSLGALTFGASASSLYAAFYQQVYDLTVDASGVTTSPLHYINGYLQSPGIVYVNGIVYATQGPIYNPATHSQPARSSWFPVTVYSLARAGDGKTLYAITDRQTLDALDVSQGTLVGSVSVPGAEEPRRNLVRWGADGMAFVSGDMTRGGNIYLIRSDLVH